MPRMFSLDLSLVRQIALTRHTSSKQNAICVKRLAVAVDNISSLIHVILSAISFSDLLKVAVALATVWFGFWLRGFESYASLLGLRVDEVVEEVNKVVDAGSNYWRRDTTGSAKDADDIALEAEIQGRIHSVNELFENISKFLSQEHCGNVRRLIVDLRQTLTGRDFASVKGHDSSGLSISQSFSIAAQLRVELQLCLQKRKRVLLRLR